MEVLPTHIDPRSEVYRANRQGFLDELAYLEEQLALARAGGGEKYVERHRKRGKLMARERIELLLCSWTATPPSWRSLRSAPGAPSSAWAAA
jgi:hypothetical protein